MHVDYSRYISHPTTLGTIHIRHVNSVALRGVLKAGVDCICSQTKIKHNPPKVVAVPAMIRGKTTIL